ncbi:vWA domain-containing protein [Candidatus Oscillochloris fontis]|uniref:vWA domain-containing protein n=1 Tax=Candidatus Oscillochloris fontis TaxID=2496868 RepID=UPI00101CC6F5|nr:vWA domain-containing protein [Candidatus Oscillochloris fontis]
MMKLSLRSCVQWLMLVCIVCVVGLFPSSHSVAAQVSSAPLIQHQNTATDSCFSLDVAVIVDQSNSMRDTNDREEFRIIAAREVIAQLGFNRLYLCPDAIHRIAIISFGDTTVVELPFTPLTPQTPADWKEERIRLGNEITPKSLDATHFIAAFAETKRLFDELPPVTDSSLPRKRAVLIIRGLC